MNSSNINLCLGPESFCYWGRWECGLRLALRLAPTPLPAQAQIDYIPSQERGGGAYDHMRKCFVYGGGVMPGWRARLVHCREPKKGQQKVQLYYEDDPLCTSRYIIYLCAQGSDWQTGTIQSRSTASYISCKKQLLSYRDEKTNNVSQNFAILQLHRIFRNMYYQIQQELLICCYVNASTCQGCVYLLILDTMKIGSCFTFKATEIFVVIVTFFLTRDALTRNGDETAKMVCQYSRSR